MSLQARRRRVTRGRVYEGEANRGLLREVSALRRQGQERWPGLPAEVGFNRLAQMDERAATALDAGRQRRPDAFAPAASRFAPRALCDLAVNDYGGGTVCSMPLLVGSTPDRSKNGEVVRAPWSRKRWARF